mmetsp:Transcript_30185/g.75967  ORF Transcript_30185/g.75967 Transcript_30185/m.75967 type:complete len:357 (+) Transcript_30185:57-1127(+)
MADSNTETVRLNPNISGGFAINAAVIGGGSFGTAMAVLLARNGHKVKMLVREENVKESINANHRNPLYMKQYTLPETIVAYDDNNVKDMFEGVQLIVHAIPVQFSSEYLAGLKEFIPAEVPVVSISKGIKTDTYELMCEILPKVLPGGKEQPILFLSGPSFAEEIIEDQPTAVVLASTFKMAAKKVQVWMSNPLFRIYTSTDVIGVNLAGALKNVIAIAAGMLEGMGFGRNTQAGLITRGNAEITRLGVAMGAKPETMAGLAGIGDLVLTCYGSLSRNRTVGQKLALGVPLDTIIKQMKSVAEGVYTTSAAVELAKRHGVEDLPIIEGVASILKGQSTPLETVMMMMIYRPFSDEF